MFTIFLILFTCYLKAQTVEFVLKDSLTAYAIANATLHIKSLHDKKDYQVQTDNAGRAVWRTQGFPKEIVIKITAASYKIFKTDTILVKADETLSFAIVKLSQRIDEVVINDPRTLRYSQGKLTYIPKKNVLDQTQSITELFPAIPGISKRNGKYYFRNESNFLILIDGVGENRSKEEQLAILENMPVNSIIKIEFIDQPSARYGNNITGIINVITKKNTSYTVSKFGGTVQNFSNDGNTDPPLSFNGNLDSKFRVGSSNFQIALRLNHTEQLDKKYNNVIYQPNRDIQQNSLSTTKAFTIYPYLSIDHSFSKRLSAQVSTYFSFNKRKETGNSIYNYLSNNISDSTFNTKDLNKSTTSRYIVSPQLKYILDTLRNTTLYLNSTLALLGDDYENNYQLLKRNDIINNDNLYSRLSSNTKIIYFDIIGENILNGKILNVSAGTKFNFLKNIPQNGQSFQYEESVGNVFISSEIKLPKTKITSGIRTEFLNFENQIDNVKSKENLTNFFPSFTIQRELGLEKNVSLGYQRNILRMSSMAYNTQIIYRGYLNGTVGNNSLEPRITNHLFLQFYLKSHVFSINYKLHNNHRIFVPLDSIQPYIMRAITYNHFKQLYVNYNKDFQVSKFWNSNLGIYCYFNRMDNNSLSFRYNKAVNYQIDWYNTFTMASYNLEIGLNYNSPYKTESGMIKEVLYNNITLSKAFKQNTWNVRITANDFLGVSKDRSVIDLPLLYRSEGQLNNQQSFTIQLSYRFPFGKKTSHNQYKSDIKDEIRN
ncbi:hypothetical protein D3C86_757510 [compost metagenome]